MNETSTLPGAKRDAAPPAADRSYLEAWRRFHFGDPASGLAETRIDLVPAALASLRGVTLRTGWPLVVEPHGTGEAMTQPLGNWLAAAAEGAAPPRSLADNLRRLELRVAEALNGSTRPARVVLQEAAGRVAEELALPAEEGAAFLAGAQRLVEALSPEARLVGLAPSAVGALLESAARGRLNTARRGFAAELQDLVATVDALLEIDRARRPDAQPPEEKVERMGALGSRFVDPDRLSGVVGRRRQGAAMPEARRVRLEEARRRLAELDAAAVAPLWVAALGDDVEPNENVRLAADPCSEAAARFDERAESIATVVRAARIVRLEAAGAFDPGRHLPGLDRLDWRSFTDAELALVPPVLARLRAADLLDGAMPGLLRLLLSGRPVHVVVSQGSGEGAGTPIHLEPAYLGIGLREIYVHQGSLARPAALVTGFARALAGCRPALHVIDLPPNGESGLDPFLVAAARVSGRVAPVFRYEPEAGASWARRLRFEDNPEPAADWPREGSAEPSNGDAGTPFTFADAALLDPVWRGQFAPVHGESEDLVGMADWLALPLEDAARKLPTIVAVARDGSSVRLVVSRALALATRDRLSFWRTLEELAGVRNEHVEEAATRARREAEERAAREREQLLEAHGAELERVRAEADAAAVDHLVSALFDVEATAERALPPARPKASPTAQPAAQPPGATPAVQPVAGEPAAPEAAAAAEAEEAWVDTALCTSCDECTRKYPAIFAYNGDKQAYVKSPRGGTFRDLVQAAEVCTAKVIHPGTPWNPAEPGLEELVARAERFS